MHNASSLVIVGASYAGLQLAASARELGFQDRIVIVGDEVHRPYQRPPLSKTLLTGKTTVDKLPIRGADFFETNKIELLLGTRATTLDLAARTVEVESQEHGKSVLEYGWLALTTGARPRPFTAPGAELGNVFDIRTLDDALHVIDRLASVKRVCVIGGGFIGLEVASALRTHGAEVTVVEAQPHLLTRTFPPAMSRFVEQAHRSRGVELLTGRSVHALHGEDGKVSAVELADGTRIACDMVVLGIGVLPNSELAEQAGIACDNGILTDLLCRTSAPNVLAIGDVANMALPPAPGVPERMRLESIQSANDSARAAASVVVGREAPCVAVPWFWSDQFELKFQMTGLHLHDDQVVVRGDMASEKFSVFYLREGTLVAAHTVSKPAEHMQIRKLITARVKPDPAQLADESFDLKTVV